VDIAEEHNGDVTIVEIKGRIDSNTSRPFGDRLTGLIKAGRKRIVVDLKNLVYISSTGFRALLLAGRLFDLGAFTDLFPIYSSREEGLTKLS
jgi:anti-sigma B factor antagonist